MHAIPQVDIGKPGLESLELTMRTASDSMSPEGMISLNCF